MDDLVEWLPARLDEDERVANAAAPGPWRAVPIVYGPPEDGWGKPDVWEIEAAGRTVVYHQHHEGGGIHVEADAEYIARNDPARVLREVQAKRRRLARHQPMGNGCCDYCHEWGGDLVAWPCVEIRDDASVYADSPGYREEWRP